ncbi:hypothetical protein Mal64_38660 [Pseudobythopirellula maris]|uniref:Uncharacterized protein n=1 Tax=Pseudobythopirellula maris TaxID=2527991 RepID=A0A5C5ZGT5_9BACT|nr:hypothetical protein [Pseudobythopirellula maris]TWT86325.1 hypothetical protein Mal64_38660 [Pseudobythopirellula maris]
MFERTDEQIDAQRMPGFLDELRQAAKAGEEVRLRRVTFDEAVDLAGLRAEAAVRLVRCTFRRGASLERANLEGGLFLPGCEFHDTLNLTDARVIGPLDLSGAVLKNLALVKELEEHHKKSAPLGDRATDDESVENRDFHDRPRSQIIRRSGPALHAARLSVDGETLLAFAKVSGSVQLGGSDLCHDLDLTGLRCDGGFCLHSARLGGSLGCIAAKIRVGPTHLAFDLGNATVGGSVFFLDKTKVIGSVDLHGKVGSQIVFSNATITAETGRKAVNMENATVGGSVFFRDKTKVIGSVDLRGEVGSQIVFSNATITAETDGMAVNMENATVGGSVFFCDKTKVIGSVDLRGEVGSSVEFLNATITAEPGGKAVNMGDATVGGSVFFHDKTKVTGSVDLRGEVESNVEFSNATITAETDGMAVNMENATVGGAVLFRDKTKVLGSVNLRGEVGSSVEFSNATINAEPDGKAVDMENATVGRSVFFRDKTKVVGSVDLRGEVGSNVEFSNATINAEPDGKAVDMENATVGGSVFMLRGTTIVGSFVIYHASIGLGVFLTTFFNRTEFLGPGVPEAGKAPTAPLPLSIAGDLWMDYAEIGGPVLLHDACVDGRVSLRHAKVAGDLDLCGGIAGARKENPLRLSQEKLADFRTHWRQEFHDCQDPLRTPPEDPNEPQIADVDLRMARIGGRLWLKGQRVLGTVDLEDARIEGEANFTHGRVHGDLRLRNATIVGRVFGDETDASGPYPQVSGRVDARGAKLSELVLRVDLSEPDSGAADPTEPNEKADTPKYFRLDEAQVRSLQLMWDFRAGGPPLTVHQLQFEELLVNETPQWPEGRAGRSGSAPAAAALDAAKPSYDPWGLASARLRGSYGRCRDSAAGLLGSVRRAVLNVSRTASDATRRDRLRQALWLAVWCAGVAAAITAETPGGSLVLFVAGVYLLASWLRSEQSHRPAGERDAALKAFMRHTEFSPAFYVTVERWLRARGDDPTADDVFLGHRRRELSAKNDPPPPEESLTHGDLAELPAARRRRFGPMVRLWRWCVMDFLLGYGVRPSRMIHAFLLLLLLSWGVFLHRDSVERPLTFPAPAMSQSAWESHVRRDPNRQNANPYHTDLIGPGPEEWDAQQALFMALRVSVPIVDLFAEGDWAPSSDWIVIGGRRVIEYENYAAAAQVANLIIIPLAIAGLAGFLKRRQ